MRDGCAERDEILGIKATTTFTDEKAPVVSREPILTVVTGHHRGRTLQTSDLGPDHSRFLCQGKEFDSFSCRPKGCF